jgi:hypothetical protein
VTEVAEIPLEESAPQTASPRAERALSLETALRLHPPAVWLPSSVRPSETAAVHLLPPPSIPNTKDIAFSFCHNPEGLAFWLIVARGRVLKEAMVSVFSERIIQLVNHGRETIDLKVNPYPASRPAPHGARRAPFHKS